MDIEQMAAAVDAANSEGGATLPGLEAAQEAAQGMQEAETEAEQATALAVSEKAVNFIADLAEYRYDCLKYGQEVRKEGAEKIAPLLVKYGLSGGILAEYLERWKEEIAAGMFFGGVIFASYQAVKADKAAKAAAIEPQPAGPASGGAENLNDLNAVVTGGS